MSETKDTKVQDLPTTIIDTTTFMAKFIVKNVAVRLLLDMDFISLFKEPLKIGLDFVKDEALGLLGLGGFSGPLSRVTDFVTETASDFLFDSVLSPVLDGS